jgi:hypothetical protein
MFKKYWVVNWAVNIIGSMTVTSWLCAPPSLQFLQRYRVESAFWGEVVETECTVPRSHVKYCVVVYVTLSTMNCRPSGTVPTSTWTRSISAAERCRYWPEVEMPAIATMARFKKARTRGTARRRRWYVPAFLRFIILISMIQGASQIYTRPVAAATGEGGIVSDAKKTKRPALTWRTVFYFLPTLQDRWKSSLPSTSAINHQFPNAPGTGRSPFCPHG